MCICVCIYIYIYIYTCKALSPGLDFRNEGRFHELFETVLEKREEFRIMLTVFNNTCIYIYIYIYINMY